MLATNLNVGSMTACRDAVALDILVDLVLVVAQRIKHLRECEMRQVSRYRLRRDPLTPQLDNGANWRAGADDNWLAMQDAIISDNIEMFGMLHHPESLSRTS